MIFYDIINVSEKASDKEITDEEDIMLVETLLAAPSKPITVRAKLGLVRHRQCDWRRLPSRTNPNFPWTD